MPLRDHFHPPLSRQRHWDSFYCGWVEAIVRQFNQDLLAAQYFAEALVKKDLNLFEVQVLMDEEGPRLVAAIELVSPANKDRAANRRMFAVKCASYLQSGVAVLVIDVVTERRGNLHAELLQLLETDAVTPGQALTDLYAAAYRTLPHPQAVRLEIWAERLTLGSALPTLPLWIHPEQSIPINLEQTYQAACAARRIR